MYANLFFGLVFYLIIGVIACAAALVWPVPFKVNSPIEDWHDRMIGEQGFSARVKFTLFWPFIISQGPLRDSLLKLKVSWNRQRLRHAFRR